MDWLIVLALVGFGLGLIILEFIFIPGTTFVGFIGFGLAIFGIYLSYEKFGVATGTTILCVSLAGTIFAVYYGLKSGVWEKFSLQSAINSRVNEHDSMPYVGEEGKAISALRPSGKAEFNHQMHEVHSFGSFVEAGSRLKILKIEKRKIWVESLPE